MTVITPIKDALSLDILALLNEKLNQTPDLAENLTITAFFDAQGLACPMPLLKAKIALRQVASGDSLYLLASDKNSQKDLVAYCQKNDLSVHTWLSGDDAMPIFHFIISKP